MTSILSACDVHRHRTDASDITRDVDGADALDVAAHDDFDVMVLDVMIRASPASKGEASSAQRRPWIGVSRYAAARSGSGKSVRKRRIAISRRKHTMSQLENAVDGQR